MLVPEKVRDAAGAAPAPGEAEWAPEKEQRNGHLEIANDHLFVEKMGVLSILV